MKKTILIVLLAILLVVLFVRYKKTSTYAPPREPTTVPPFVEPSMNYPKADNQSDVFMDAGGWVNQREHPLTLFIQGDARRVGDFGAFVGLESSSGSAPMYVLASEEAAPTVDESGTCPSSSVRLINSNRTLGPGTHSIDRTSYYIEVIPPMKVVATGPNTRFEMEYPSSETCPAPVMLRLDETKTYDTLILSTDLSQTKCPRSVARLINKDQILEPGTYSIDRASYLMEIYPPLKVIVSGPSARQELNYPTNEDCPMPVNLKLDNDITYDTLILSTTLSTKISNVSETPFTKMGYDINEFGNLINPTMFSASVDDERNFLLPNITSRSIPFLGDVLTAGGQ